MLAKVSMVIVGCVFYTSSITSAFSAQEVSHTQGLVPMVVVSVGQKLTPDEVTTALSKKADLKGARYFKIISLGGRNKMYGTATIYK